MPRGATLEPESMLALELAITVTVGPGAVTVTLSVAVACTVKVSSDSADCVEALAEYTVAVEKGCVSLFET